MWQPWLPYERLIIETYLSLEDTRQRLEGVIEPRKWFRLPFLHDHKPYQGEWNGEGFRVSRVRFFNLWKFDLLVIHGKIISQHPGTIVELVLRPPITLSTIIYAIALVGLPLYIVLSELGKWLSGGPGETACFNCFFAAFFALILYLRALARLKREWGKSRRFFRKLLERRPPDDWDY